MAIGDAKKKNSAKKTSPNAGRVQNADGLGKPHDGGSKMFATAADRSTALRIYIKDRDMLKKLKMAALEEDTSISQLFEDWAMGWLAKRG